MIILTIDSQLIVVGEDFKIYGFREFKNILDFTLNVEYEMLALVGIGFF